MRSLSVALALALLFSVIVGCDSPPATTTATAVGTAPPGPPGPPSPPATPATETEPAPEEAASVPEETPQGDLGTERVKAEVGVGAKGRSLDEHEGFVVTPVKTLFSAKERIAFEIEVPHAMQLYLAANLRDRVETHEEFMEKVIAANQIKLPPLPQNHRYLFDPETQQLMVERPKKKPTP